MQTLKYDIDINASKAKVWEVLWGDKNFRDWANIIDEGTYMVGELKLGNKVEFLSGSSGYGVTSMIEELIPFESILFKQMMDTQDLGENQRSDQWTGGQERYSLGEVDGITRLEITIDVPDELVDVMNESYPRAVARIKELAEEGRD